MFAIKEEITVAGKNWIDAGIMARAGWIADNVAADDYEIMFAGLHSDVTTWLFRNESDATAFRLRWGINGYN